MTVNVHEAKTDLSALLKRVEAGEEVSAFAPYRYVGRLLIAHARIEDLAILTGDKRFQKSKLSGSAVDLRSGG